ncbi:hypothetical protein ACFSTI_06465 [Rhizorhabdus histidinilytica]
MSQAARQAALEGLEHPLGEALARSYPLIAAYRQSDDRLEAERAWAERRPPRWSGR